VHSQTSASHLATRQVAVAGHPPRCGRGHSPRHNPPATRHPRKLPPCDAPLPRITACCVRACVVPSAVCGAPLDRPAASCGWLVAKIV
jgi:hypothetical protein